MSLHKRVLIRNNYLDFVQDTIKRSRAYTHIITGQVTSYLLVRGRTFEQSTTSKRWYTLHRDIKAAKSIVDTKKPPTASILTSEGSSYAPADIYFILSSSDMPSCSSTIDLFASCTIQVRKAVVYHHAVVCHVFPLSTEIAGEIADNPNAT